MPELPDVERYRRFLSRHGTGRVIRGVEVTDEGILRNTTGVQLDRALRGHRFEEPMRHGKWLVAWTSGPAVLLHFGMTGDLTRADGPEGRHRHDRVIFVLQGGGVGSGPGAQGELRYRNMRKLGGLWLAHDRDEVARVTGDLGPDALGLSEEAFLERLGTRRGRIKPALMDQRLVAGVGNILADEILWRARLHPERRIDGLTTAERRRLGQAFRGVVTESAGDGVVPGDPGRLSAMRGERDAPCPRCGRPLARATVGGRTSYFCPRCQRARP